MVLRIGPRLLLVLISCLDVIRNMALSLLKIMTASVHEVNDMAKDNIQTGCCLSGFMVN